jgi:hypothetical protein
LFVPDTKIARPAVDENDGAAPFASGDVMHPVSADGNKMRFGVSRACEKSIVGHAKDSFPLIGIHFNATQPELRPQTVD